MARLDAATVNHKHSDFRCLAYDNGRYHTYMAVRPLKSFFTTSDVLLAADLPRLGEVLLVHVDSYTDRVKQQGKINPEYLRAMLENRNVGLGPLLTEPEYGAQQPAVTRAAMEAWNWLEREGMVTRADSTGGWFTISRRGEELIKTFSTSRALGTSWRRTGQERSGRAQGDSPPRCRPPGTAARMGLGVGSHDGRASDAARPEERGLEPRLYCGSPT